MTPRTHRVRLFVTLVSLGFLGAGILAFGLLAMVVMLR